MHTLTQQIRAPQRARLPDASERVTTGRWTRTQVADEAIMVAMSVGACLGGDEPCREQIAEKQKSDLSGPEETVCFGQRGSPRFY